MPFGVGPSGVIITQLSRYILPWFGGYIIPTTYNQNHHNPLITVMVLSPKPSKHVSIEIEGRNSKSRGSLLVSQ